MSPRYSYRQFNHSELKLMRLPVAVAAVAALYIGLAAYLGLIVMHATPDFEVGAIDLLFAAAFAICLKIAGTPLPGRMATTMDTKTPCVSSHTPFDAKLARITQTKSSADAPALGKGAVTVSPIKTGWLSRRPRLPASVSPPPAARPHGTAGS